MSKSYPALAKQLYEKGLEPIPIAPGQKYPTIEGWPTADCGELVKNWKNNNGVGIRTGRISAIDIDVYHPDLVDLLVDEIKPFSNILTRVGQPPKTLIPCIIPELKTKSTSTKWIDDNGVINQIELLSHGQQFVCYGIHPDTKKPYEWSGDLLSTSLPIILLKFLIELFIIFDIEAEKKGFINASAIEKTSQDARKQNSRTYKGDIGNAPGSIYNRVTPIEDVLEHYGWKSVVGSHWRRPDKKQG